VCVRESECCVTVCEVMRVCVRESGVCERERVVCVCVCVCEVMRVCVRVSDMMCERARERVMGTLPDCDTVCNCVGGTNGFDPCHSIRSH